MNDVLIIGAGIAGLAAARSAAAAGARVSLIEAERVGGAVASTTLAGLTLDAGAEAFATRGAAVESLLTDLEIAHERVDPVPTGTWIHRPNLSLRLPDAAVLGIPTELGAPELDALGAAAARRARADADLPPETGADAPTLGALVRARMGDAVADAWVGPLVAGVQRVDIDSVAPEVLLPGVRDRLRTAGSLAAALGGARGGAVAGLRGGMHRLIDAVLTDLSGRGVTVLADRAAGIESTGTGWAVATGQGLLRADRLLLAAPPWQWPQGVPAEIAAAADSWPRPRQVDLVSMVLASDGGGRRAGVVVADGGDQVRARALTYSSAKWAWLGEAAGERVVIRLTYDGVDEPDGSLVTGALTDAAALTGARWRAGDLLAAQRRRWAMPRSALDPGMSRARERMREAVGAVSGLDVAGGWIAGSGLAWTLTDGVDAAGRLLA